MSHSDFDVLREAFEPDRPRERPWRLAEELLMQAPVAISVVEGPEHRYVLVNPEYERMFDRRGFAGRAVREVFPELPSDAPVLRMLDQVRASGAPFRADEFAVELAGDDGLERRYFQFSCSPVRGAHEPDAILTVAVDVTDQVRCRRRAEAMAEQLAVNERRYQATFAGDADRQKDEFLAMLSHELRNPLAAIRSASALLDSVEVRDPLLARVHTILSRQTSHMAHLLDELLDVARVRSGKLTIVASVIDLCEVVREALADVQVPDGGPTITAALPDAPLWVEGDRVRLAQVVHSLLSNAIKYTPASGSVRLDLADADGHVVLTVTDTGVGIEPELREHLFEPFQQAPQDIARSAGGLGLGLALAKTIVELHDGSIAARSPGRDQGSEFEVRLPLTVADHRLVSEPAVPEPQTARVLVVEDNEDAAELLAALLRAREFEVEVAARGEQALAMVRSFKPDAVLCDIGLPDIDGYTIARTIRADPALADIKLVALSGYGQSKDRVRAAEAGFDQHLTKPAAIDAVVRAISPQA